MNDDQYDDFKQLLTQTLDAAETRIKTEITSKLSTEIKKVKDELGLQIKDLSRQMEDGFAGVGVPINTLNDTVDDHETRLTKLEHKVA